MVAACFDPLSLNDTIHVFSAFELVRLSDFDEFTLHGQRSGILLI